MGDWLLGTLLGASGLYNTSRHVILNFPFIHSFSKPTKAKSQAGFGGVVFFPVFQSLLSCKNKITMAYKGPPKLQKVMVQPINLIFRYLQNRSRVQIWLYENVNLRLEGHIVGFDEYMNIVLDEAEEYHVKTKNRRQIGRIMMKGDNITLIQNVNPGATTV